MPRSVRHYSAAVPAAATAEPAEADEALTATGQLSAKEYRQKYSMFVLPADAPAPYQTFDQAQLPPQLLKAVSTSSSSQLTHQGACLFCRILLRLGLVVCTCEQPLNECGIGGLECSRSCCMMLCDDCEKQGCHAAPNSTAT